MSLFASKADTSIFVIFVNTIPLILSILILLNIFALYRFEQNILPSINSSSFNNRFSNYLDGLHKKCSSVGKS
jgi:hypothetical protein